MTLNKTLRWAGTGSYLVAMALTSFNVYPWNVCWHLLGGVFWTAAALGVDDTPLLVIEAAAVVTYTAGLVAWAIH